GILPDQIPDKPFFIDIEHANALVNFLGPTAFEAARPHILEILTHPLCRGIVPISHAAARSLELALGRDYDLIRSRVHVIYPSLPIYRDLYKDRVSHEVVPKPTPGMSGDQEVNFLFVGKEALRKGLPEVLEAFERVQEKFERCRLFIVSDAPGDLQTRYAKNPAIHFFSPQFSTLEVMTQFFLPADIFLMPTLEESYGMVFMEALSCGKPVVLTRQFATPEIIRDGENGLFLDLPPLGLDRTVLAPPRDSGAYVVAPELHVLMVRELEEKMAQLVLDKGLRERLSTKATIDFENEGKFSNTFRNKELVKLFEKAKV
ncbi:glycosyltransferase family 4 protein, partial [Bdellovibrionota bacterium FG-2]